MKPTQSILIALTLGTLTSCSLFNKEENYDTAGGYDTSDPYGTPSSGGYETAPYQQVNPPANDPTYGNAAYEETATVTPTPAPAPVPTPSPAAAASIASTHTVVRGDTLWGISRKYGVSMDAIRAANGMTATDNNVVLGRTLNIPAR
ncbi:MAG: LysM peptidoglycan-binding domain-containing protein [Akkermansiaceae bacterium]|nr:LysM peptidoglycan-binding domain-containing protein [Akkermansiaceae bacterium]